MYDNEFGEIKVTSRAGMCRITARWRNGGLAINKPHYVSLKQIARFVEERRDDLRGLRRKATENKPAPVTYYIGQRIPYFRGEVLIVAVDCRKGTTGYQCDKDGNMRVFVSSRDDIATDVKRTAVSGALQALMKRVAPDVLVPFAEEVAREIGVSPREFVIGRGMRKLGHCTTKRVIQLSYNLMFMPEELVRYIICHELAHLTHMNHSAEFHALCNHYCNGREKALERALKNFTFPIIKPQT